MFRVRSRTFYFHAAQSCNAFYRNQVNTKFACAVILVSNTGEKHVQGKFKNIIRQAHRFHIQDAELLNEPQTKTYFHGTPSSWHTKLAQHGTPSSVRSHVINKKKYNLQQP